MQSSSRSRVMRTISQCVAGALAGVLSIAAHAFAPIAEVESNDTAATATPLPLNSGRAIGTASINPGGDLDFWRIDSVPAGARIWVSTDTGGTQNGGATSRDTVMDLLAADGITVIENDDDDGTANGADGTVETQLASAIAGKVLVAGGTYYIRVRAFSATGIIDPYKLYVVVTNTAATAETEANNTAATANPILSGGATSNVFSGSIGAAGDADYYSMPLAAGDVVFVSADADPERDGTGTDLVVEVRDPADVLLLSIDSSITGSLANPAAEAAPFQVTTAGTYFVKVRHFGATGIGTYHLMVANMTPDALVATAEVESNNTAATATLLPLNSGRAIGTASINPGGDLDFWRIDGVPVGARIWVSTDTGGTQNGGATSRDTVMDLLAADGTTVIENDDDDGTGNGADGTVETGLASAIAGKVLVAGGTYYIRVRAFSLTGIVDPYKLYVVVTNTAATAETEANDTAATANPILSGGATSNVFSGLIGAAGDVDYYSMPLAAGDVVFVSADADPERDGTGTDLVVEVRDPADLLLLSIDSSITGSLASPAAEAAPFQVTTAGTYFVKVRHFGATGIGSYHLMVANMTQGGSVVVLPTLSIADPAPQNEGNAGTSTMTFNVTLSPSSLSTVTVRVDTADGTATAGSDYVAIVNQTVTFAPGQTSMPVVVTINGDTTVESDETFFVNLSVPTNATIADGQATGTILNDDLPSISINDPAPQAEGNAGTTTMTFTVTLSQPSPLTVTVRADTADGTATAGSDYVAIVNQIVTFAPGQTSMPVVVTINGDTTIEPNETLFVNLSLPTNATIADSQGVGTIINDDSTLTITPSANINFGDQTLGNPSAEQTVTLTAHGATVTLNLITLGGANPGDFVLLSGPGACTDGQLLTDGSSCTLTVRFIPTGLGGRSATVTVTNTTNAGDLTLLLAGTGVPVALIPTLMDGVLVLLAMLVGLIGLAASRRIRCGNSA